MSKNASKIEYYGKAKALRLLLMSLMMLFAAFCFSACITIQMPESTAANEPQNDAQNDMQTEDVPITDDQAGQDTDNGAGAQAAQGAAESQNANTQQSSGSQPAKSSQSKNTQQSTGSQSAKSSQSKNTQQSTSGQTANTKQNPVKQSSSDVGQPKLSEDDAIRIVLGRVKGSTKSDIIEFELDYDDGRWEYEGKLRSGGTVYEFEIDAQTGNILEWEIDD